jgi:catechol 2,3-dioxygenase-like lactoylglutathione lyase family enzyme
MHHHISGIQQIGIGVKDARENMLLYKDLFGMDVLVFDDTSDAVLMSQYTGGKVYNRRAVLSLNMQGGGGFEIWQFNNRQPSEPISAPLYGDIGIYAPKIKCNNILCAHQHFLSKKNIIVSELQKDPKGDLVFYVNDNNGNVFQVVWGNHWFQTGKKNIGGVTGSIIGVTDMEQAISFYKIFGLEEVVYDVTGEHLNGALGGTDSYRKVLLQKHPSGKGAFGKLFGSMEIELIQCLNRKPGKIYADRFWGDCGFIHLCFDVVNMDALKKLAENAGYKFTVDSCNSFAMDNASGRFCYLEDPDGTLIELVETHKVPILKKWGIYFDLRKRSLEKPLPDWMVKMLSLSKVK